MAANNLSWVKNYIKKNLRSQFQFKVALATQLIGMIIEDVLLLFFWYMFFEIQPEVYGWKFTDLAFLYALVTVGFGLANAFFGNCTRIASIVYTGELDYYLSMPTPTLLHLLISRSSISAWGDILFGVLIFILIVPITVTNMVVFIGGAMISAMTFVSFAVITGSVSFFVPRGELISRQFMSIFFGLSMYPTDIFPVWVKVMTFTILPAAFLGAAQVKAVSMQSFPLYLIIVFIPAILLILSIKLFYYGLKRYESGSHPFYKL